MLKHLLLITSRSFLRRKSTFLINLGSLTVGLVGILFIFLWVHDERQMDKFHTNDALLFQVMNQWNYGEQITTSEYTHGPLAATLKEEIPEIAYATNIVHWMDQFSLSVGERAFSAKGYYVGVDFFQVFRGFKLLAGTADRVLEADNSVAISESTAIKLFGSVAEAMGSLVKMEQNDQLQVSGVFADVPARSTIQFDFVMPYRKFILNPRFANRDSWDNTGVYTMFVLQESADLELVTQKINEVVWSKIGEEEAEQELTVLLRRFSDAYLYGNYQDGKVAGGRIAYVRLFSIIGLLILLIACINFMNLATAQASERAKEIGVKKTLGIRKSSLVVQYLLESTVLAFFALLLALTLVNLFLPAFNSLTDKFIFIPLNVVWLGGLIGMTLLVGLLAGSYPAFYLSSFRAVKVLKGETPFGRGARGVRKTLVVFQFAVSVILIIAVLVVYQQIQYVQTKDLGYEKNNLIQFILNLENRSQIGTFVEEAKNLSGVAAVSSGNTPINLQNRTTDVMWDGKDPDEQPHFYFYAAHYDLLEMMDVQLKEGRFFSRDFSKENEKAIINEQALATLNVTQPIGTVITLWDDVPLEIVGVVKDFHFQSFHEPIKPLLFRCMPEASPMLLVKLEAGQETEALSGLQALYKKFNPGVPFDFEFIDQQYNRQYTSEQKVGSLAQLFAGFVLFISCLGLFGLTLFTAAQRKKEISIRKVFGASVTAIVGLFSREFLRLVGLAILIAFPVAWYFSNQWLQNFAFHIDLSWWVFALAGLAALLVAFLTVSVQSVKSALANPVEHLRSE